MGDVVNFNNASFKGVVPTSYLSKTAVKNDGEYIAVQGNYLYVAYYQAANSSPGYTAPLLEIYDITDPTAPVLVGTLASPSTNYKAIGILVRGKYAYLPMLELAGFYILDVSDPTNPSLVSSCVLGGTVAGTLYVQGRYAYYGNAWSSGNFISVVDLQDPTNPTQVGILNLGSTYDSTWPNFFTDGRFLYAIHMQFTPATTSIFSVIDVSDPASPSLVSSLNVSGVSTGAGYVPYISVQDRYAYIGLGNAGTIAVVDINMPFTYEVAYTGGSGTINVGDTFTDSTSGTIALVQTAPSAGSFYITPVTSQTISPGDSFSTSSGFTGGTVSTYTVTRTPPTLVSTFSISVGQVGTLAVRGNLMAVGGQGNDETAGTGGVQLVDISNPSALASLGVLDVNNPYVDVEISGNYLYATSNTVAGSGEYHTAVTIWNLSDSYFQQFEVGNLKAGSLKVSGLSEFGNDVIVAGAMTVQRSAAFQGDVSIGGTSLTTNGYHVEASEYNEGNSGTAQTIDWSASSAQLSTLTGNVTYTFTNPVAGAAYILRINTGAGGFSATWPSNVKWSNGSVPTVTAAASKVDLFNFYYDGTYYYGNYSQNF